MIPSLKYLCLKFVISHGYDYQDLPRTIVKDIDLMKMFNATYWDRLNGFAGFSKKFTIFYDGVYWNLKSGSVYLQWDTEDEEYVEHDLQRRGYLGYSSHIKAKEGEKVVDESGIGDFLDIKEKITDWKLRIVEPTDDISSILSLAAGFSVAKAKGAIAFHGLRSDGTDICCRLQVEIFEPNLSFGSKYLHRSVVGEAHTTKLFHDLFDEDFNDDN